jgi:hypothetical protein
MTDKFVTLHDCLGREVYIRQDDGLIIRTPDYAPHEAMSQILIFGALVGNFKEHPLEVKRLLEHGG